MNNSTQVLSKIFQDEYSRLLAVLVRVFGVNNIDLAEDTLHETFCKASLHWEKNGIPTNPTAWLTLTAKNHAIDVIRKHKNRERLAEDLAYYLESEWSLASTIEMAFADDQIQDDQLRMMFMCCRNDIAPANQLPLILKLLCGLSTHAISRALLIPEQTVKKRLQRTKGQLKQVQFSLPADEELPSALTMVHTALYLLFNEGFHSSEKDSVIEITLCQEAIGLVNLLIDTPKIANSETLSLFALMHFHISRIETRTNTSGAAIPLDLQDRTQWKTEYIQTAINMLSLAEKFTSEHKTRFYYEAIIAREHCTAKHFKDTRWGKIIEAYEKLHALTQSPVAALNGAIAKAYNGNIEEAIVELTQLSDHTAFKKSHIPLASLAHCYAMKGDRTKAKTLSEQAKKQGGTPAEHKMMTEQLKRLSD